MFCFLEKRSVHTWIHISSWMSTLLQDGVSVVLSLWQNWVFQLVPKIKMTTAHNQRFGPPNQEDVHVLCFWRSLFIFCIWPVLAVLCSILSASLCLHIWQRWHYSGHQAGPTESKWWSTHPHSSPTNTPPTTMRKLNENTIRSSKQISS